MHSPVSTRLKCGARFAHSGFLVSDKMHTSLLKMHTPKRPFVKKYIAKNAKSSDKTYFRSSQSL